MKYTLILLALFCISCSQKSSVLEQYTSVDFEKHFKDEKANGCFIIHDFKNNKQLTYNTERLDSAFLPASTFKIINSMIALETKVIKDENELIKWDGVDRRYDKWNMDQNLATGIKYSAVWFYQELARRIGKERMQSWVSKSKYGNENINGGIDVFWLSGDIRITPNEQIDFLKRLYLNELPFSKDIQETVKRILIVEENERYTIRAKTGWAARIKNQIGWYVGYLENRDNIYFFALNMDIKNSSDAAKRKNITNKILKNLKLTN
jgi:beta-lactamase class D